MQDSKDKNKPEKKELRCPFSNIKCEDCRLYRYFSKEIGKECSIILIALRS